MTVGIRTALEALRQVVAEQTPKGESLERFVHSARELEDHSRIRDRIFTLEPQSSPEPSWLSGRAHRVRLRLTIGYKGDPAARIRAAEDLSLLQYALVDPRNHRGANETGIISVRPPSPTTFEQTDAGGLLAHLDFSLIYLEAS